MLKYLLMSFLGLCWGCASGALQASKQNEPLSLPVEVRQAKTHLELSYGDLEEVLLTIQATVDATAQGCPLPSHRSMGLSQSFKRLLDERYLLDLKKFSKMNLRSRLRALDQDCQSTLSCTVFYGFIDYLKQQDHVLHPEELKKIQRLNKLRDQTTEIVPRSVDSKWVCKSLIFKNIQDF